MSAQPPAKKTAGLIEKKLSKLIVLLLIVGAVFNRDLLDLAYTYIMKFHTRCQDGGARELNPDTLYETT